VLAGVTGEGPITAINTALEYEGIMKHLRVTPLECEYLMKK
jgi:hypothetical protein